MKELSIEEKAKAYDRAIEELRGLLECIHEDKCDIMEEDIIKIFPELKESEDEKIRKWLISQLKIKSGDTNSDLNIMINKAISYLEKQGEQKPQGKSALEAINEEKVDNANKVEPKFKVGDWITNSATKPAQISSIEDGMYFTHNDTIGGDVESIDKEYHLWTIKDAKAGDVLATEDIVFIFKHIDKTRLWLCKSYCEVIGNSKLGLGFDFSIDGVYPASKEQRELLHSKIKEAGYEWDAEKLELKKIKPEFWSDDDNMRFNGFKIELGGVQKADDFYNLPNAYHIFATKKQAKSALAMARISQIMANDIENFGGVITDEEWLNDEPKFAMYRYNNRINTTSIMRNDYKFLAFHRAEQRDLFLEKYPQLVKDYLMIPDEEINTLLNH